MPSLTPNRGPSLPPAAICWRAFESRDSRYDTAFVVAVRSTGIYCRPSCPARHPKRQNVEFMPSADAAERNGFRACLRCKPRDASRAALVAKMTRFIEQHAALQDHAPVSLAALAKIAGMSPQHVQRVFRRVVGITPRQFADTLRLRRLKKHLRKGDDVTTSLYEAGYGSSSRLYERSDAQLGMTPATYRRGGVGMTIAYTVVSSPLGRLLVAATERGVSAVYLGEADEPLEAALREEYPRAQIHRDANGLGKWVNAILRHLEGAPQNTDPHGDVDSRSDVDLHGGVDSPRDDRRFLSDSEVRDTNAQLASHVPLDLPLDVQATAFQKRVWDALRTIPYGSTKTYSQIAKSLGQPKATRAVARACATNPVSIVVPCHRVVRQDGNLAGYRWGISRKQMLLDNERQHTSIAKQPSTGSKMRAVNRREQRVATGV